MKSGDFPGIFWHFFAAIIQIMCVPVFCDDPRALTTDVHVCRAAEQLGSRGGGGYGGGGGGYGGDRGGGRDRNPPRERSRSRWGLCIGGHGSCCNQSLEEATLA